MPVLTGALAPAGGRTGAQYEHRRLAAVRALVDPVTLPSSWVPWRSERRVSGAGDLLGVVQNASGDPRLLHHALGALSQQRDFYSRPENRQAGTAVLDAIIQAPSPDSDWDAVRTWARGFRAYLSAPDTARDPGRDVPIW